MHTLTHTHTHANTHTHTYTHTARALSYLYKTRISRILNGDLTHMIGLQTM
jgi:hypothetical protein